MLLIIASLTGSGAVSFLLGAAVLLTYLALARLRLRVFGRPDDTMHKTSISTVSENLVIDKANEHL